MSHLQKARWNPANHDSVKELHTDMMDNQAVQLSRRWLHNLPKVGLEVADPTFGSMPGIDSNLLIFGHLYMAMRGVVK